MAKSTNLELRFAVGEPAGLQSSIWRVWSWNSEVYLAVRHMARIKKYSFHSSGVCREAFTDAHGTPSTLPDRAILKWTRQPTPPKGQKAGALVACIGIANDYLSAPRGQAPEDVLWLAPTPPGEGIAFDLFFTHETQDAVTEMFAAGGRRLVNYTLLPNGERFAIAAYRIRWGDKDLVVPGEGKLNDLVFSADHPGPGRPIRIVLSPPLKDGGVLRLYELGG